jgi:hypothetical protein
MTGKNFVQAPDGVPDIGVNIDVNVTRYRVSSDMTRYRVTRKLKTRLGYRDM